MKPIAGIDYDGSKVWVNAPICLARLCQVSGEVVVNGRMETIVRESFDEWRTRVQNLLGICVPEHARPKWSKKTGEA